ncbi:MAG: LysR family transcriptional regulator [Marinosulfonomonas sp.]|nr:LysR family transcriptional regulator [Marinosulfonomonas sp.]
METQHFRFIRCVARHENISAAARELGITQPALTKILSRVEDLVGSKLFDRGPRGVVPTTAGRMFLDQIEPIERSLQNLTKDIHNHNLGLSGTITIAAGQFWLGHILPGIIARLHQIAPGIQINIVTGTRDELLERVKLGTADMMLGRITEDLPDELECEELAELRIFIMARAGHPLATQEQKVQPEDLAKYPWILPTMDDPTVRYSFEESGLEVPVALVETVSRQFSESLLLESDYLCALPCITGWDVNSDLVQIQAEWFNWATSAGVVLSKDRPRAPACEKFLEMLRNRVLPDRGNDWR